MESAIEFYAAVAFTIIGLSHVAQPRAWVDFFRRLHALGPAGALFNGILCLSVGSFVIAFHNVWHGLPMVVTLLGWAQGIKGAVNLLALRLALRGFEFASERKFVIGGILWLAISAVLWYVVFTHRA